MEENNIIPDFIKNSGLDFNWDKNKIWELNNVPIEEIIVRSCLTIKSSRNY